MPLKLTSLKTPGSVQTLNAWADSVELLIKKNNSQVAVANQTASTAAAASAGIPTVAPANEVYASPNGVAGPLSVRALVPNDIPALDASKITTGLISIARGGTGTATPALIAGSGITITGSWPDQTISASGGGAGGSSFFSPYNSASSNTFGGNSNAIPATNSMLLNYFQLPYALNFSFITLRISVPNNPGALTDVGVYNMAGSLLCSVANAVTGAGVNVGSTGYFNFSMHGAPISLQPAAYWLAATSNEGSATVSFIVGNNYELQPFNTGNITITGSVCPTNLTPPAENNTFNNQLLALFHN